MSDVPSESGFTTLSLRDKALIKRNIKRHHNSNFRFVQRRICMNFMCRVLMVLYIKKHLGV